MTNLHLWNRGVTMSQINKRILEIMKEKGITQKELSNKINTPTSTINTWLQSNRKIPADTIIPISEFLNVSPHYLLTGMEQFQTISEEDAEWLNLIHQLPSEIKFEFKGELKGYIKGYSQRIKEESNKPDSSLPKAT